LERSGKWGKSCISVWAIIYFDMFPQNNGAPRRRWSQPHTGNDRILVDIAEAGINSSSS